MTFKDGAATLGTTALNGSAVATLSISSLTAAASPHSITAVYNGDGNFNTSTSPAISQTVNKATPTASVISLQNPSIFTQPVTFQAGVLGAGVTPTGNVTFKDGLATLGTSAVQPDGTAQFNTSTLGGGNHNITAVYNGDGNYNTATSSITVQQVILADTETNLATSGTPSTFGQVVTFTATVTSFAGTPAGTVTFKDGLATLGTSSLSGGVATLLTSSLPSGAHSITAQYNSNGDFSSSTSAPLVQTVNQAATTVMLSSTKSTSHFRESVTFMVTVIPSASGIPTGTVTFFDGATQIGSPVPLNVVGQAQVTVNALTVGRHQITAQYSGDVNFPANNSTVLEHNKSPKPR